MQSDVSRNPATKPQKNDKRATLVVSIFVLISEKMTNAMKDEGNGFLSSPVSEFKCTGCQTPHKELGPGTRVMMNDKDEPESVTCFSCCSYETQLYILTQMAQKRSSMRAMVRDNPTDGNAFSLLVEVAKCMDECRQKLKTK